MASFPPRAVLLSILMALAAGRPSAQGAATAAPKGSPVDISSQVDRSEITIGDRIRYEIKVVYPAAGRVELPSVLGNLGSFEVKDYQASEPKPAGNLLIQTWHFDLSTFTVGKYMIPPQQVIYLPDSAVYFTQPIEINVVRTSSETVKDIADIAGLAETPRAVPWLAFLLGAALLAGLAAWLWRKFRRGKAPKAAKPPLPPYDEAMELLAELKKINYVRQNRTREFGFLLSEGLRRYVSRRFGVDALESTTSEFLELARTLPVTAAQKEWLKRFCESADLVKFAGSPLLESESGDMLSQTEEFLRGTRPREEPGPQGAKAVPGGASTAGTPPAAGGSGAKPAGKGKGTDR